MNGIRTKRIKAKGFFAMMSMLLLQLGAMAQVTEQEFTLLQAQDYAVKNSYQTKTAQNDADIANISTEELIATGLPQINGSLQYLNNIYAPYTIIPAGQFGPNEQRLRFQQPHNVTAGVSLNQLLFSGTWLVGLEASKSYAQLQTKLIKKSSIEVKNQVAQSYYLALVAVENVTLLKESRGPLEKTLNDTKAYYENGFAEKQDVDQLQLSLSDLDVQINYAEQSQKLTLDLLKFQMGFPLQGEIKLTDSVDILMSTDAASLMQAPFTAEQSIDYELASSGLRMQQLNVKAKKAAYLPSLAGFWTIQTQAQRQEFNFFDTSKPYLYGNFWGLQLSVPILSGGQRKHALSKAELEVKKVEDQVILAQQGAELEYRAAKIEMDNALKVYEASRNSLELAKSIYKTSEIKYSEGVASSFDLTQRNGQAIQAQGAYIQAMLNLLKAKNRLAKALNQY
jgi:outer membrane protein